MSFIVERILNHTDNNVRAIVNHHGNRLDVEVAGPVSRIAEFVRRPLTVEIGYAGLVDLQVLEHDSEAAHGLFQPDPANRNVRVVGRVHNVVPLDDGDSVFDVSVQAGPEFLSFDSTAYERELKVGNPVAVILEDLCFYPT